MSLKALTGAFLLLSSCLACSASPYKNPKNFSQAFNVFKKLDFDYTRTMFTNEKYAYDPRSCLDKFYLQEDHKQKVVFIRIVPEEVVLKRRRCGVENICTRYDGSKFKGSRCCRTTDKLYKQYDGDIFNIMPIVKGNETMSLEPPLHARGNIARVYLYMNAEYGLGFSAKQQLHYLTWHKQDPVDAKECDLHDRITEIQGRSNPWIRSSCETLRSRSSKSSQE